MRTRRVRPTDEAFLREMSYLAAFVPPGAPAHPRSILDLPEMRRLFEAWGRPGDTGIIAEIGNRRVAAAWVRLYSRDAPTWGYLRDDVPVLAVAVVGRYRGLGIGTRILAELIDLVRARGSSGISLSVDQENPALRLYERIGFAKVQTTDPPGSNPTLRLDF